ncbi:hypothetical protein COV93_00985 [Candidatus Woesearchaeota archaeon CG11_big_fil_rev_8_21_14_0_20_43_8]|nr:MAG: hypothetical protein COV93_00985 [Candidatus Woesearchaeota archaeon CG11_big_fil_rev_8_21_14_0_20_43_8]PIO04593.1 MAG: hypothetical protein COT47_08350 [Candidatus Woesearchaeota archaeon CG08_land_8_20_14_0_20_43_7]
MWEVIKMQEKMPKVKRPVLIEGLPGIGNVGKVAIDFIIENLKAKKIFELFSNTFPHSVFVNEENLVELPNISVYHKKIKDKDFFFLAGDIQPTDEVSSYEFSNCILDLVKSFDGREVVTLGGIALAKIPREPRVYCTGNSKDLINWFKKGTKLEIKLYGVVGPIVGVSGLLLGLGARKGIKAVTLLAETLGHPMYLGMEGAREIIQTLNSKYNMSINLKKFDEEIKQMESELMKKPKDLDDIQKTAAMKKLKSKMGSETSYIG